MEYRGRAPATKIRAMKESLICIEAEDFLETTVRKKAEGERHLARAWLRKNFTKLSGLNAEQAHKRSI